MRKIILITIALIVSCSFFISALHEVNMSISEIRVSDVVMADTLIGIGVDVYNHGNYNEKIYIGCRIDKIVDNEVKERKWLRNSLVVNKNSSKEFVCNYTFKETGNYEILVSMSPAYPGDYRGDNRKLKKIAVVEKGTEYHDLRVEDIIISEEVKTNKPFQIIAKIKNDGDFTETVKVGYKVDSESWVSEKLITILSKQIREVSFDHIFLNGGNHTIIISIESVANESNIENNEKSKEIIVEEGENYYHDLSILNISINDVVVVNESIPIKIKVYNDGLFSEIAKVGYRINNGNWIKKSAQISPKSTIEFIFNHIFEELGDKIIFASVESVLGEDKIENNEKSKNITIETGVFIENCSEETNGQKCLSNSGSKGICAIDRKGEWACDTTGVAKLNGILYQKCWYNSVAGMFPTEAVVVRVFVKQK